MPLSNQDLLKRLRGEEGEDKRLIVDPYFGEVDENKSMPASLDFHLGPRFMFLRRGRGAVHDPVRDASRPESAGTEVFIPLGMELYLHPGQLVLGATLEWFRFPHDLMAYVIGRSIWGRRGLLVVTASAVQPNSSGTITLELSNVGEVAVIVRPGVALGQLFFHLVEGDLQVGKSPPFSVTHRPIFGRYKKSAVEQLFLPDVDDDGALRHAPSGGVNPAD